MIKGHKGTWRAVEADASNWSGRWCEQLVIVLKALQIATTETEIVSASLVHPAIHGLLNKHLVSKPDDLPAVKAFKEKVSQEISSRDSSKIVDRPAVIATVTDPHYHQLKF